MKDAARFAVMMLLVITVSIVIGQGRSGGGSVINYTTTERQIGMYLGDKLYEKTVDLGALPNSTTKNVAHGISNIDIIVDIEGWGYNSGVPNWIPLPYATAGDVCSVIINGTNISLASNANLSALVGKVTLRYTKTGD